MPFVEGNLVWVLQKTQNWPGEIVKPPDNKSKSPDKDNSYYCVKFYGTHNTSLILEADLVEHSSEVEFFFHVSKKSTSLHNAFEEMKQEIGRREKLNTNFGIMHPISPSKIDPNYYELISSDSDSEREVSKTILSDTDLFHIFAAPPDDELFLNQSFMDISQNVPLDTNIFTDGLETKVLRATDKEIGFLGFENLSSVIAKSLLKSGHFITVWNKSRKVCNDFVMDGIEQARFPSELIQKCDITFCCVSESELNGVIFGSNGVLDGLQSCGKGNKGFVMMTSLDLKHSQEISEEISNKCGRYLEAHFMRPIAKEESLAIFCAGNITLFHDCTTCFSVVSNSAFYVGVDVGSASKMKAILSRVTEAIYAALWEILTLMHSKKTSLRIFNEFVSECLMFFPALLKNAIALFENNSEATTGFKSRQSVSVASLLGEDCHQPSLLAAATNTFLLNAQKVDYKALADKYTEAMQLQDGVMKI